MRKQSNFNKAALCIALLFHICGLIGILLTPYKEWFIHSTVFHLSIMTVLLIATHQKKDKQFFLFFLITCIAGFLIESLGVNTAVFFGKYVYSQSLGPQFLNAPLIIGVNWFIIIYCAGMFTQAYENYMLRKLNKSGLSVSKKLQAASFIIDAVFLTVMFDWIMEPAAVKLGYWQWQNNHIPLFNYISWIMVSALLLALFRKLNAGSHNTFAVHLFIIQLLFFLVLRTFL